MSYLNENVSDKVSDLGIDQETKVDREHERILNEIETTDTAFIGASLRAVYEGNDHKKFLNRLDSRIKQHDKDIEKMCNFHYQGFIDSITELINVRGDAKKLKNQTIAINKELHDSGKEVMDKSDTLIQCRLQQRNVVAAIEKLTICLPILQMYAKICDQMKEERYYAALKTLEQLETTYLPQVYPYRFCEIMKNDIPTIRDTIRQKSTLILNNFLENVRSKSKRIGMVAMKQVEKESCLDEKVKQDDEIASSNSTSQASENEENLETDQSSNNPFLDNDEQLSNKIENVDQQMNPSSDQQDLSASDIVDFSPVYKCLHIFGLINLRSWFEDYYRKQRRKQVELILESVSNLGAVETYTKMFHEIVGFFVVEDHILHTAQNLVTQSYISELWNMVLLMLLNKLAPSQINLPDARSMMKIKNSIVIFADTLKAYGFTVDRLFSLLMEMRDTYGEMMLNLWQERFSNVFSEDNYTPIYLETIDDVDDCLLGFPCEFNFVEASKYPKKLPFSLFVPKIYSEIKEFILECLKYCEDLHLSSTEVDDMIRKSTNLLLTKTLSCGLKTLVQKPSLGLNQLVQIIVNTTHLENSCPYVEEYVRKITGVKAGNAHSAKLVGVSTFKDARSETETQIYTKLNEKIDAFFELADYDWTMSEPQGLASRYLVDLISFLRTTFQVFTTLPTNVAQTACMSACRHISTCLTTLILDTGIKEITVPALHQFNLDVVQCEHFANSEPVPGFDDGVLQMSFTEIRQLLDLILTWDWTSYFADYATPKSKYLRVNPAIALSLFEKIKQEQGGALAYFTPSGRGKKRINDQVHKQLRNLVSGSF